MRRTPNTVNITERGRDMRMEEGKEVARERWMKEGEKE